jgi:hypothetical protein
MGKKDKKKKEKLVYFKPVVYSKLYDGLYNNEKYSDIKIKLENSGQIIFGHKNILSSSSTFLYNKFKVKSFQNSFQKLTKMKLL